MAKTWPALDVRGVSGDERIELVLAAADDFAPTAVEEREGSVRLFFATPALRERAALIVWGGRDFCFDDTFLARWQRELPGAQVHRIADAGHYVLDDARDEVLPLIASHLAGDRP